MCYLLTVFFLDISLVPQNGNQILLKILSPTFQYNFYFYAVVIRTAKRRFVVKSLTRPVTCELPFSPQLTPWQTTNGFVFLK